MLKNIKSHQYLPFINYKKTKKEWQKNHERKTEYRTISVCSHKDNYIYQYFNNKINPIYEKYIINNNLTKHVCAFRSSLKKSNINIAKEIVNYIKDKQNCHVLILDISKFFDNLDHNILKTNLKKVLNVETLPK